MRQLNLLPHTGDAGESGTGAKAHSKFFLLILLVWFLVNILQAVFTQIGNDEAYYTLYAQRLDWGYFDHPPFIAFLISAGHLLFNGEAGTRFFVVVAQVVSLYVLWNIISEKEISRKGILLFFGIAASIPLFQIYGFIATPDAGLLFFTALFFWSYRRFLQNAKPLNILFLSLSMAGLMYSKYHGALVILLTIFSNLKLLANFKFWLSGIIALAAFSPHIIWQVENQFPTFQYQMVGRAKTFMWKHFLEFWPNQLLVLNPLVVYALILSFKHRTKDSFSRALWTVLTGFILFFGIASFWVRPEPHWTAAVAIPAIIIIYRFFSSRQLFWKKAFAGILISVTLILLVRLFLIFDVLPVDIEFHHQKKWALEIDRLADGLPVAFLNSYQKPSVYSFYTGKPSFSLNNVDYRQNQFDLWQKELKYEGKPMAFFSEPMIFESPFDTSSIILGKHRMIVDTLFSFQRIKINLTEELPGSLKAKNTITIPITIHNPYAHAADFSRPGRKVTVTAVFIQNKKKFITAAHPHPQLHLIPPNGSQQLNISFDVPDLPSGRYQFGFGIKTDLLPPAFNSRFYKINIIP